VPASESGRSTGTSTPLQPISTNAITNSNIQMAALNRLAASGGMMPRVGAGGVAAQIQQAALQSAAQQLHAGVNSNAARAQREMSLSGPDAKRRRLNATLGTLPPPTITNTTRHSSLGPGTPRAGTPSGSRAGSVGPSGRPGLLKKTSTLKKATPSLAQQLAARGSGVPGSKKGNKSSKKGSRRPLGVGGRASPSTTTGSGSEDESDAESSVYSSNGVPGSQENRRPHAKHHPPGHGDGDVDMDEASDDTKYCYCHDVSHGDMIACDNADCKIQWFHWTCAGITSEPQGEWLCRECSKLPRSQIRKS
jgi:inhibitor of growth protein 3